MIETQRLDLGADFGIEIVELEGNAARIALPRAANHVAEKNEIHFRERRAVENDTTAAALERIEHASFQLPPISGGRFAFETDAKRGSDLLGHGQENVDGAP